MGESGTRAVDYELWMLRSIFQHTFALPSPATAHNRIREFRTYAKYFITMTLLKTYQGHERERENKKGSTEYGNK